MLLVTLDNEETFYTNDLSNSLYSKNKDYKNVLEIHQLLNWSDFISKYELIPNSFDATSDILGCQFDLYGEELSYVMSFNPFQVWTILEISGKKIISPGLIFTDSLGYLISVERREFSDKKEYLIN